MEGGDKLNFESQKTKQKEWTYRGSRVGGDRRKDVKSSTRDAKATAS